MGWGEKFDPTSEFSDEALDTIRRVLEKELSHCGEVLAAKVSAFRQGDGARQIESLARRHRRLKTAWDELEHIKFIRREARRG